MRPADSQNNSRSFDSENRSASGSVSCAQNDSGEKNVILAGFWPGAAPLHSLQEQEPKPMSLEGYGNEFVGSPPCRKERDKGGATT